MAEIWLYIGVFIGAATPLLEVWVAVPLGVVAGLPWLPAALVGFVGNFITLLPVIYLGDKIQGWMQQRRKTAPDAAAAPSRKRKIFERYGVPGLAVLGPFLIGVHAASAFAIAAGAGKREVLWWFAASILFCSLLFGLLAEIGMARI